jgi:hypothetical protein
MPTSTSELPSVRAVGVKVTEDELSVDLEDDRTLSVPLAWYPRLLHGTKRERTRWQLIGRGVGIHWPELDDDISVEGLLAEVHWYEAHGVGRREMKIKFPLLD